MSHDGVHQVLDEVLLVPVRLDAPVVRQKNPGRGVSTLGVTDEHGREHLVPDLYSREEWSRMIDEQVKERHPDAYSKIPLRHLAVWDPPSEPWQEYGIDWHKDPALRRAHREAVRRSLEDFLNGQLAKLYHYVRTGWWVLGKVRVKVTQCRPVPERELRAWARAILGKARRKPPEQTEDDTTGAARKRSNSKV